MSSRPEDLRILWRRVLRRMWRSPRFAVGVVSVLALGIGANTAVFALLRRGVLRSLAYPNAEQLVGVGTLHQDGLSWESMMYNVDVWISRTTTLESIAWVAPGHIATLKEINAEPIRGAAASSNLLAVLRVHPIVGRWFTRSEELGQEPVVVLSYETWRQIFRGTPSAVIGRTVRFDDRLVTIVGVLPPDAGYPLDAQYWFPNADNLGVEVVARKRPSASLDDVRRELYALAPQVGIARKSGGTFGVVVTSLRDRIYGSNGPILRLLSVAVALLLILTCTNVANLSLARTFARQREIAICAALGASRLVLASEIVVENALLALAGGAIGVLMSVWVTSILVASSPPELRDVRGATVGIASILLGATAAMAAAVAVSVLPAYAVAKSDLRMAMGHAGAVGPSQGGGNRARRTLVAVQLALALLLLSGSALLIRSMERLTGTNTGFDRRGLVVIHLRPDVERYADAAARQRLIDAVIERLRTLPGVRSVAIGPPPLVGGHGPAFTDGYSNVYSIRDSSVSGAPRRAVWVKYVDASYIETFRIALLAGRGIAPSDGVDSPPVALVNSSAATLLFGHASALGRSLDRVSTEIGGASPPSVIGLLQDVRQRDIDVAPYPEIWMPIAQHPVSYRDIYVSARTDGDPETVVRESRGVLADIDPKLEPTRLSTMDAIVRQTLAPQRFILASLSALSIIAVILACVGLYSLMAYVTTMRTREMGVRIALGAAPRQVQWLILRDGLNLALIGLAIGIPLALATSRLMNRFLYGISPRDLGAFLGASVVLVAAVLVAAYPPAKRVTVLDPVRALQSE